jgi:hypothetical protein
MILKRFHFKFTLFSFLSGFSLIAAVATLLFYYQLNLIDKYYKQTQIALCLELVSITKSQQLLTKSRSLTNLKQSFETALLETGILPLINIYKKYYHTKFESVLKADAPLLNLNAITNLSKEKTADITIFHKKNENCDLFYIPIYDKSNKVTAILEVENDISLEKKAKQELRSNFFIIIGSFAVLLFILNYVSLFYHLHTFYQFIGEALKNLKDFLGESILSSQKIDNQEYNYFYENLKKIHLKYIKLKHYERVLSDSASDENNKRAFL